MRRVRGRGESTMSKASIQLEPRPDGGGIARIRVLDSQVLGKQAKLIMQLKAKVHDSRAVNSSRQLAELPLTLSAVDIEVELPAGCFRQVYSYRGSKIDVHPELRLEIDDGVLFDSSVDYAHELPLGTRPRVTHDSGELMDPKDAFNFFANLSAIPPRNRMITLALTLIGGVVIIANALLGLHDQFVPEAQTFFYDHSGSDGSESPLMKALVGCGALGTAIWVAIKMQLRKYMRFGLKPVGAPRRGQKLALRDLVDGVARVPLEDITFRVIACNRECGQYKRGSGTKERTVSFRTPTRAVKLYERYVALVPANTPLAMYLDGEIDFEPMFGDLYPPLEVGSSHGVEVAWEVQLLHPKFVDHELEGPTAGLAYEDFLDP